MSTEILGQALMAILAGALLNLTPCVLPAIPVKIRTIVRESGAEFPQRLAAGLSFLAGSLLFFLVLGVLTALLHWTWGTLFQSRIFLVLLIVALTGFAIFTFVDANIPVPTFAYSVRGTRHLEALLSGAFSALLGASCTGPFLGGVLAFSVTQPPAIIVGLFLAVGLGLALPYLVILLRPSLLDRLPKIGSWSQHVRQGLAFVLLAAAVFFAQNLAAGLARPLWLTWAALLILWALRVIMRDRSWPARLVVIAFMTVGLAGLYVTRGPVWSPTGRIIAWQPLTHNAIMRAAANHRPVLLEFTAGWCINCKVLEQTVYADAAITHVIHATNTLALRGDLTHPDGKLQTLLQHYGGHGLPFALVINSHGVVVQRFSGLFTREALLKAIGRDQRKEKS